MFKLAYKVLSNTNSGQLFSARASNGFSEKMSSVEYFVNKFIDAPEGTRLFTFEKLDDALYFKDSYEVVYQCLIEDYIELYPCSYSKSIVKYWELVNSGNALEELELAPYKSLCAKRVMLLKEVSNV